MGVDYWADTIIGLKINENSLKIIKKQYIQYVNCDCKLNNIKEHIFCPMCGHKNNFGEYPQKTEQYIKEFTKYDESVDDINDFCEEYKFNNWMIYGKITINGHIYTVIQINDENNKQTLYVSICMSDVDNVDNFEPDNDNVKICPFTLEKLLFLKIDMKTDLSTIGLWNDDSFGIYTIFQCNY